MPAKPTVRRPTPALPAPLFTLSWLPPPPPCPAAAPCCLPAWLAGCRVASPKLVMEEAPESYKDVSEVVDTCHAAGISKKTVKLRPIAVVKG